MSLSTVDSITKVVDYDSAGFSFLSTVGGLIGNRDYSHSYRQYMDGGDNSHTFYWKALSAVGDDLAETVYENVRNYIQYVSDVDTCKVKSLRSMMQLFNYKCTVLDNFINMPQEVLKLIDVLSIDKKYLAKAKIIRPELAADMASGGVFVDYAKSLAGDGPFEGIDFRSDFSNCTYVISTDAISHGDCNASQLQWKYNAPEQVSDLYVSNFVGLCVEYDTSGRISNSWLDPDKLVSLERKGYALSSIAQISGYYTATKYSNCKNYNIIDNRQYISVDHKLSSTYIDGDDYIYVCNGNMRKLFGVRTTYNSMRFPGDSIVSALSDIYAEVSGIEDPARYDKAWLSSNINKHIALTLSSDAASYNRIVFNDDPIVENGTYLGYIKSVYKHLLYGYVTLPYNLSVNYMTHTGKLYAYPYLGTEYFDISAKYAEYVDYEDDDILSVKLRNHVSRSFNERRIYDDIEAGRDSLDSYAGAELCVLIMEKNRREESLSPTNTQLPSQYSDSQLNLKQNQTRYSYYRRQKVIEYADFIDSYYAVLQNSGMAAIYDFDTNYWQLSSNVATAKVITCPASIDNVNPEKDINLGMIDTVADYLAMATQYVCKLRHEIKLQTQKNYMRGTNLLLIYIINEYLRDYAKHNNLSNDILRSDSEFQSIQKKLENHSLEGTSHQGYSVNIQEYYDSTEYFNIATDSTASADMSAHVNPRFWELTSFENTEMMKKDGEAFKLAEIEKFYLSALNLERPISGNLPAFLSAVYDVGANNTFVYKNLSGDLSIYSSVLSNGQFASDIFERLVRLSGSYTTFVSTYLSNGVYSYPDGTVVSQISDILSNYVYPNLSTQHLVGISDVYDKYKIQLDSLSSAVDSLSASYVWFAQTTYACYYSKSESKFCYTDHDPVTGQYIFPYFNGNPDYDRSGDNLYNHLYQLQVYSTESNIKNFALISTLTYVDGETKKISSDLQVSAITDLKGKCGFVDINSPTLDGELQYTYSFVNQLITSRQDFLKSQLASLQTQAQSLKTSYDTLNNTFTNAVANFNDNNAGYRLGDAEIYWFSTYKDESGTAKRVEKSEGPPSKPQWDYAIYVGDPGCECWYCGVDGEKKGNYIKESTDLSSQGLQYNAADSLEHRCKCVLAYMRAPTSKTQSQFQYGLQNEGIVAVCDNVTNGLSDIRKSFDNVAEQAENLFGVEKPQQTDIYSNILELVEKLTAVDEKDFQSDPNLRDYKGYFTNVIQLSARYVPVKAEYTRIFTDKAQTNYLTGFSRQDGLTFENIQELSNYITKTDKANRSAISETINKFINVDFQALIATKSDMQLRMEEDSVPGIQPTTGNDIETRIFEMNDGLLKDVSNKYEAAVKSIDGHKFLIHNKYGSGYFNAITSEISSDLGTTKKFTSCVKASLDRLNFFDHDIYRKYKDMFLTYGGRDFCYDPYYNMKNVTHPSYQIHPYLWNFVKKLDGNTLINSGFKATVVDALIESNVLDWLKGMDGIGEYGQTVNTWKSSNAGMIDYSGYRSMYERGSNWSSKLNAVHEVVDYEGAFYPPALNEYRATPKPSISSVYDQMTKHGLYAESCKIINNELTDRISSYVTFNEDGTVQPSAYSAFALAVSPYVLSYVHGGRCSFNKRINDYLALPTTTVSTLSWVGIKSALYEGIPETFYEKYYSQVELTKNEARRIGMQLQEYEDDIRELTDPKPESEQYDIYKYGVDINKTHYALFKKYDYSDVEELGDLTYDAKRNTLGRMWIRQGDHPIAFPAFSGKNPAYYIGSTDHLAPVIVALAQKRIGADGITWGDRAHTVIRSVNDPLEYFYDFEISQNKASLAYVIFDPKYPLDTDFYRQFKLANVTVGKVETYQDKVSDVLYLKFNNSAAQGGKVPVDYIDFHKGNAFGYVSEQDILSSDVLLSTGIQYPALVGYHVFDNNSINFVYTYQDFKAARTGDQLSDLTQVHSDMTQRLRSFVVQVENGDAYKKIPEDGATFDVYSARFGNRKIVGSSMCVGYNRVSERLTFAYVTELTSNMADLVRAETISGDIAISAATEGAIITDPLAQEMNSHDKLTQNITLVEAQYKSKSLKLNAVRDYNTNADISYIPAYPGYEHEFNMPSCYGVLDEGLSCRIISGEYQNIELLGESKDIERYVELVNPNPDPYFDYQSVKENTEFGRVYEDYKVEFEKTFTMIENPSLNFNSPAQYGKKYSIESTPNQFVWTINLNRLNPTPFGIHDLKTMQVIVYNADTLGKNPYYIGKLWDFIDEQELNYNKPIDDGNTADFETSCVISMGLVKVTGTHRDIHTHSERDTNHIDMIDRITAVMYAKEDDLANATLTFTFDVSQNAALRQFAKVPQGELKIMLYNNKDLEIYQYYHMLDAYGAVQCKYFESLDDKPDQPDDGRGWGIYYPKAQHVGVSSLTQSFFKDKSGLKTYLDSIQLSDYESLSDVYVYRGNKMLSFKNEETYRFPVSSDLYYYPTLNVSYPKKAANYVESNTSFAVNGSANTSVMYDIFDSRNLFVMTLEDTKYIADKIGQVDIPILYNDVDDVRAYEDYLDEEEVSPGVSAYNYQRYDVGDPRIAQYLHFTATPQDPSDVNKLVMVGSGNTSCYFDSSDELILSAIGYVNSSRVVQSPFSLCASINTPSKLSVADDINAGIVNVKNYAFSGCSRLLSVSFPHAISIGKYAFRECSNLQSAYFSRAELSIGEHAFLGCRSLSSVVLSSVFFPTSISYSSFGDKRDWPVSVYVEQGMKSVFETADVWKNIVADRIIEIVEVSSVCEGITVPDSSWMNKSVEDFASYIATQPAISAYAAKSEEVAQGVETEYVTTYASRETVDIARFLRFYVNYRRDYETQSLDLYFNYFNYIDSPYVRLENGTEMKIDTIESTYLKLKAGEDGVLDIIVQFKHYIGGVLYGYKNVKVLSYHIYNISDDKPKFLMYKTYEVQPGQAKHQVERGTVKFQVDSVNIQLEDYMSEPEQTVTGAFRVVAYSDKELSSPYDFYFDYPSNLVNVNADGAGYYVDEAGSSLGMLHVVVTNPGQKSYSFGYETKYCVKDMLRYKNRKYSVSIDEANVYDCDGLACLVELADASMQFTYTTSELLGIVKDHVAAGAYVAVEAGKAVVNLSKV